jgi:PAS domain S-box-containing protein
VRPILVVETDPATRDTLRVTLRAAGWPVLETETGAEALALAAAHEPALILQALRVQDMSGFELARRLRALSRGPATPIIAVTAMLSSTDEVEFAHAPFADLLARPVEPSRLLGLVARHAPREGAAAGPARRGQRVLVCDDDPHQLKLLAFRIRDLGFEVETASDGKEGLERALRSRPDAIVSDILMPELDGFGLCLAVRQDPRTAGIPVVLASSAYVEPADHALAARVGASACVARTPDVENILAALTASISTELPPMPAAPTDAVVADHLRRVVRQTERQAAVVFSYSHRARRMAAELAALESISDVLGRIDARGPDLSDILGRCLEAGGVSEGVLYLGGRPDRPPRAAAVIGFAGVPADEIEGFFSHPELLDGVLTRAGAGLVIPSPAVGNELSREILGQAGVLNMVAVPIAAQGQTMGALVMGARAPTFDAEDWLAFARTASLQIGQALALAETLRQNVLLLESVGEGIWGIDPAGLITFVNRAGADMIGGAAPELIGRPFHPLVHPHCYEPDCDLAGGFGDDRTVGEALFHLAAGSSLAVEYTATPAHEDSRFRGTVLVFRDLTERQRARKLAGLEELRRQELEVKDQFLSHVSHELRTPLAVIHQFVSLLLDGLAGPLEDEQREYLAIVSRNVTQLRIMIGDLLEATRGESNRVALKPEPVSVAVLVVQACDALAIVAREKGIRLTVDVGDEPPIVHADPARVGQVLMNLIENALKFTPDGGAVSVSARPAGAADGGARVSVSDNGVGILPEELPRVFESHFQGTNTANLSRKGFGIGLHVCKNLVERHGGRLWVESRAGEGSTFSFTLPAVPAETP